MLFIIKKKKKKNTMFNANNSLLFLGDNLFPEEKDRQKKK